MLDRFDADNWRKKFKLEEFPEPEVIHLRYPVLLCHGYGAIASIVKPSPLYDVALTIRAHGVLAYAPNIVPYAKIEIRAQEWVDLIHKLIEQNEYDKFNIIAHSMGGLDMRYALSQLDVADHVASFTTISTPHRGTSLAELALKAPELIKEKLGDFFDWMGDRVYPKTKSDTVGSVEQLTRPYVMNVFNSSYRNVPGIPYYSYSAAVGKGTEEPIQAISRFQNNHIFVREGLNDGFVSVESAIWGEHIQTVSLSHLEQMNLRVNNGRKPFFESFWKDVLLMLQERGH